MSTKAGGALEAAGLKTACESLPLTEAKVWNLFPFIFISAE
jgi:hypothetical protein